MRKLYNRTVLMLYSKPVVTLTILFVTYGITRLFFTRFNFLNIIADFMGFFVLVIVYSFYELKDKKMVFWIVIWYIVSFIIVLVMYRLNITFIGKVKLNPPLIWLILYIGFWVCYFIKEYTNAYISKRNI